MINNIVKNTWIHELKGQTKARYQAVLLMEKTCLVFYLDHDSLIV